jgi:membrane-associated protease RseP (regulator of RpoE activity)
MLRLLQIIAALAALSFGSVTLSGAPQERGYLGVQLRDLNTERARELLLDSLAGALIVISRPGSPAEQAGLRADDIILTLDDLPIKKMADVLDYVGARPPGTNLKISIWRSGERRELSATIGREETQAPPPNEPILRIETGMHVASIWRIGIDAACRLMVTGSQDKTARLWALPEDDAGEPKLLRVLRVPIGDGNDGQVRAVALSPNGEFVAAGGWNRIYDHWVYIFDSATGRLVGRLGKLRQPIQHLVLISRGNASR